MEAKQATEQELEDRHAEIRIGAQKDREKEKGY